MGIGYGYSNNSGLFDLKINGVGIPLELNYHYTNKENRFGYFFFGDIGYRY